MKNRYSPRYSVLSVLLLTLATSAWAQQTPAASKTDTDLKDEDVIKLSPFEVSASNTKGYAAATTLAGNRLNTDVRDIGNAVTVITAQLLKDIGATDNQSLLQYTTNTEVGNINGNFAGNGDGAVLDESSHFRNPNQNTRIRGLTAADNTRDYFLTDIPWDSYSVDGVDLQRGPNSILFGQGSPAGIINTRTKQASFKEGNEVQFRVDNNGTKRISLDINHVLIKNELALRLDGVRDDTKYKQDPAYSLSKRVYGAVRWEPGFLKKGSARTIFKADIEFGDIRSNNPRALPPIDAITNWFTTGTYQGKNVAGLPQTYNYLNRETFVPAQIVDDNTGLPNHGQNRPAHNGPPEISGTPNQYYNPWVAPTLGSQFGNPMWNFDGNSSVQPAVGVNWEPTSSHGLTPAGTQTRTSGIAGVPYQRPGGVSTYATFAKQAGLPYSEFGIYKDKSLTDASVFDFYNKLLDGPNKREWQNFRTFNLNLAQTFFHDQAGFEATYNNEWFKNGQVQLLAGENQAIGIDLNKVYSDGTPTGIGGQTRADGTPNPNLGRPYVGDNGEYGNHSYLSNRESERLTIFAEHDFSNGKGQNSSMFGRLVGRHIITGLLNKDTQKTDRRDWSHYTTDSVYETFINGITDSPKLQFTNNQTSPYTQIYLGPTLSSKATASGAHIPNPTAVQTLSSGVIRTFDATWNKPTNPADPAYVNPSAYWHNDYGPLLNPITGAPFTAYDSTQSENPANYVGFRNVPVNVINSETSMANRDLLTHDARLTKSQVTSKAFTWQAHFWDNALVATYGVRNDIAKSWAFSENTNSSTSDAYGHLNLTSSVYKLKDLPDNSLNVTSHAWTAVAHLNQLPFLDKLPIQVSLFYNHSTDFQPAAQRVDVYGLPLGPPSGATKDTGILLETLDGKYSLKINKYDTASSNQSSSALGGAWFIGASQAWSANWVNRFQYNWTNDTVGGAVAVNDPNNNEYNYSPAPGEVLADAQAREASVITAWRAWQKTVDPRFYAAWKINLNDNTKGIGSSVPNGFTVTEDSESKGYEIEFSAVPTKNWRLTVNASKATATRSNIGGTNLSAFISAYSAALNTGKGGVGDLRIWWGGAGNETALYQWNANIGSEYAQRKLQEGTNVPELREWRWNAISNYDFDHGWLKGVNVGAAVRYESSIVIGYKPIPGATSTQISFDIKNPYHGPSDLNFDYWIGYSRKVWKNIDWNIQLNVRNAFVGNELIPLTTEPDGTPATYRIRPPQVISLTNTFKF